MVDVVAAGWRCETVEHGSTKTGLRHKSSTLAKCFSLFKTDKVNSSWKAAGDSFRAINTARVLKLHAVIYNSISSYVEGLTYIKKNWSTGNHFQMGSSHHLLGKQIYCSFKIKCFCLQYIPISAELIECTGRLKPKWKYFLKVHLWLLSRCCGGF